MTPCVCGEYHTTDCCCGCAIYEADDGTETPGNSCSPDHRSDPYEGVYAGKKYDLEAS